jgi:hypothetical protein
MVTEIVEPGVMPVRYLDAYPPPPPPPASSGELPPPPPPPPTTVAFKEDTPVGIVKVAVPDVIAVEATVCDALTV